MSMVISTTVAFADDEARAAGRVCESCHRPMVEGDPMFGVVVREHGDDPYGLDPASSDHPLASNVTAEKWRCEPCFLGADQ